MCQFKQAEKNDTSIPTMRKESSVCRLLGLNQQEIASLLRISRSQWSMFESGKRPLPAAANQLLAELLEAVHAPGKMAKQVPNPELLLKRQQCLRQLLREVLHESMHVERKLRTAIKKHDANQRLLELASFLNRPSKRLDKNDSECIRIKAAHAIGSPNSEELMKLEIRKDILAAKKEFLESKLRECENLEEFPIPPNIGHAPPLLLLRESNK